MSAHNNAYDILGIPQDATSAQVRQAYHRAVRTHAPKLLRAVAALTGSTGQVLRVHPDRAGDRANQAGFERVQSAWESLRVRRAVLPAVAHAGARA